MRSSSARALSQSSRWMKSRALRWWIDSLFNRSPPAILSAVHPGAAPDEAPAGHDRSQIVDAEVVGHLAPVRPCRHEEVAPLPRLQAAENAGAPQGGRRVERRGAEPLRGGEPQERAGE